MRVTYEEFLEQLAALPLTWEIKNGEIKWRQSGVVKARQLQNVLQQFSA